MSRIERLAHGFRIAGDDGQVRPGGLIGYRAALRSIAQ